MKGCALLVSLFLIFGCKPDREQTTLVVSDQEKNAQNITAKDIENLKYTDYVLGPESREAVAGWQRYQELNMQIEFLKQAEFSFFNGKNELLKNFLKDLKNDMPQSVATPAIKERLIALETKLLKFHSTLKLSNAKKSEKLANIKEVLVATSNLHLQMNKKFEFDSQVIEDPSAVRPIMD
ncbi:MAG: hypothetical protein ACSHXF_01980 [Aquaticitalea sp.]